MLWDARSNAVEWFIDAWKEEIGYEQTVEKSKW